MKQVQRIFIDNHDRILCYGNPAGYITEKEAVVDTMFQTEELESFLQKQALTIRWEDGVYDRLMLGQRMSDNSRFQAFFRWFQPDLHQFR